PPKSKLLSTAREHRPTAQIQTRHPKTALPLRAPPHQAKLERRRRSMNPLAAIEENLEAFFPHLLQFPGVRYRQTSHIWWSITRIPYPLFNGVLHTRLPPNKIDTAISEIITTAGLYNVPVLWWLLPTARPFGIGKILESWGWQPQ